MTKVLSGLCIAAALLAVAPAVPAADPELVATVNGVGIPKAELEANLKPYLERRGVPPGHAEKEGKVNQLRKNLLDNLINYELLYQEAQNKKLTATDVEVDVEVKKFKDRFPSPEEYAKALEQQGMTEASYRGLLKKGISVQKYVNEDLAKSVTTSDQDVHDYYAKNANLFKVPEQVRARHILVKVEATADEATRAAARKKIEGIEKQLKEGGDFAKLAEQDSDCPSKKKGGDLGFFTRERMVKPFADAAFAMKPGDISGVVETQFGYHLIKVEERKEASTTPESEVTEKIKNQIKGTKLNDMVKAKAQELRDKAKVDILVQFE